MPTVRRLITHGVDTLINVVCNGSTPTKQGAENQTMQTAFDKWLTETPEDQADRIEARELARANRAEPDHDARWAPRMEPMTFGIGANAVTRMVRVDPIAYLNFDGVSA